MQIVAAADNESHVYPLTRAWTTSTLHAGQFTAACGVEIYRGDALPARLRGGAFTCEPTGNLVHFETVTPFGATFRSQSLYEQREFLATTDEWFRPVALETGPDGALYIADMYRAVIEHPDWMPEELRTRLDMRDGDDRGRIYRVRAKEATSRGLPRMSTATSADLVALLERSNSWQRETAQRLLIERQDRAVVPALEILVKEGRSDTAKVHALATLAGLDRLQPELVRATLADPHSRVREQAILLSERWLGGDDTIARNWVTLYWRWREIRIPACDFRSHCRSVDRGSTTTLSERYRRSRLPPPTILGRVEQLRQPPSAMPRHRCWQISRCESKRSPPSKYTIVVD